MRRTLAARCSVAPTPKVLCRTRRTVQKRGDWRHRSWGRTQEHRSVGIGVNRRPADCGQARREALLVSDHERRRPRLSAVSSQPSPPRDDRSGSPPRLAAGKSSIRESIATGRSGRANSNQEPHGCGIGQPVARHSRLPHSAGDPGRGLAEDALRDARGGVGRAPDRQQRDAGDDDRAATTRLSTAHRGAALALRLLGGRPVRAMTRARAATAANGHHAIPRDGVGADQEEDGQPQRASATESAVHAGQGRPPRAAPRRRTGSRGCRAARSVATR